MLMIVILAILATAKITLQGYFSRGRINTRKDSFLLNGCIFSAVAVVMSILFLRKLPETQVLWYALPMAVSALGYQLTFTLAMKQGPISLSVAISEFNFLIPMIVGIAMYGEQIKPAGILAIILLGAAIVLINHKGEVGECGKWWLLLAVLACVFSGITNSVSVMFSRSPFAEQKNQLVICSNAFSALLSFAVAATVRGEGENGFYLDKKLAVGLLGIGGALGIYSALMVEGLASAANSGLFLSALNVLTLVCCALFDCVVFKQKLNKYQIMGILVSMAAVVAANL